MAVDTQTLRALAFRGEPATIEVELVENPDGGSKRTIRGRNGDREFRYGTYAKSLEQAEGELAAQLRLYPAPVTVNGKEFPTRQFSNLAAIETTTHHDTTGKSYEVRLRTPGREYSETLSGDVIIGGVLYLSPARDQEYAYHAEEPGSHAHWSLAKKVKIRPVLVMSAEEMDRMTDEELNGLAARIRNGKEPELAERLRAQVEDTLAHPDTPREHQGKIYLYANTGAWGDHIYFNQGAPIIAHNTPVYFGELDGTQDNPKIVSMIQALYGRDQGMVPVNFTSTQIRNGENEKVLRAESYEIETGEERDTPTSYLKTTDRVKFRIRMAGETEPREVQGDILMTEEELREKVVITGGATDAWELAEAMTRAYFRASDGDNWDQVQDAVSAMAGRYHREVSAALDNHEQAVRATMEIAANQLERENRMSLPRERLKVTSMGRNFTIISNPVEKGEAK